MQRPSLAVVVLALASCHLVFPHDPGAAPGGDGAGRIERGILDGAGLEVAPPHDRGPSDRTFVTEAGLCVDPPFPAGYKPICPNVLAGCPPENKDCDALADAVDPYLGDCNRLAYEEGFASDVLASSTYAPLPSIGFWSWGCGWLHQTSTANTSTTAYLKVPPAPGLPKDYLVEARVRLGPKGSTSPHWRVGVIARARFAPFHYLGCWIWENPNAGSGNPVTSPDLVVTLKNAETDLLDPDVGIEAWPYLHAPVPSLDASPGREYRLQLWYTTDANRFIPGLTPACSASCHAVLCRVCNDTSCFHTARYAIYEDPSHLKYLPPGPGTVGVRTINRAASFDYVRVHELESP